MAQATTLDRTASLMPATYGIGWKRPNPFKRIARHNRLYEAERELRARDDRLLADIGIDCDDISTKVWGIPHD